MTDHAGNSPEEPTPVDPVAEEWSDKIRPFLDSNPEARVRIRDDDIHVERPWGDSSLILELTDDLVDDLNSLRLFPEFSAVYHLNTGDLECIWGPVPESSPYRHRRFTFEYAGSTYVCEFAQASESLKRLAVSSRPEGGPTSSFYRNLILIAPILRRAVKGEERKHDQPEAITSFWIRDAPLDSQALVELANHVNFHMWYYDPHTPKIVMHEPGYESGRHTSPTPTADFPPAVAGSSIDPVLLGFWQAAVEAADPARALLHYYQIIEFGAFYFIDQAIRQEARRALREPDALAHPDLTISRLLDVLARENRDEHERLYRLFREIVDPGDLWSVIEKDAEFFTKRLEFDGGFVLDPFLAEPSKADFDRRWDPHVAKSLRQMRNALVHGRERREVEVILPTRRNHELIAPWVLPASRAAAQVMIFAD